MAAKERKKRKEPEGLKARPTIAQGKASLRATPWVHVPKNYQALQGRHAQEINSVAGCKPELKLTSFFQLIPPSSSQNSPMNSFVKRLITFAYSF